MYLCRLCYVKLCYCWHLAFSLVMDVGLRNIFDQCFLNDCAVLPGRFFVENSNAADSLRLCPEAELLDVIGTKKVLRVFLLAIYSHFC